MPASITIPISTFELSVAYQKSEVRILADRVAPLQELLTSLAPWNVALDDVEFITSGKLSDQGIRIKIPHRNASFFFGAASCRFTKEAANWLEVDEIQHLLTTLLDTLARSAAVAFGRSRVILSLHLQPKTVSFKEILRSLMLPPLLKLEPSPTEAMAIVIRWPNRRITLDGSAALANAIYLQTEREFDTGATFDDMKLMLHKDEVELFTLLDVEEAVQ
jgi:hypothetical protein